MKLTNKNNDEISDFEIKISPNFRWKKYETKNIDFYYTGSDSMITQLKNLLQQQPFSENKIKDFLLKNNRNSTAIVKTKNLVFASTSFCRDHQIFFRVHKKKLSISNDIRKLQTNKNNFNEKSLFEFATCGYTLGEKTLLKGIYSLGPAKILFSNKSFYKVTDYFRYHKTFKKNNKRKVKEYLQRINEILDDSINHIIKNSNDKTIYIPLSGGLDSRLIVSKFHEKKYNNIKCFSYGLKNNSDALIAKKVADHLNIKWKYIWFKKNKYKKLYFSKFKYKYDKYADNLSCIPNYGEIFFLNELKKKKYFTKEPIIVNGQSGDFNSGLHIPLDLYLSDIQGNKKNYSKVIEAIKKKHFGLWVEDDLKFKNYTINDAIKNTLENYLNGSPMSDIYENWEYKERQCKFVVNGQRAYEFLNFDWFLPLWDAEFVKFWTTIPLELRYKQNLYKKYLFNWNYKDVFEKVNDNVTGFTGLNNFGVKTLSFSLNFLVNQKQKRKIISYSDYFSRLGFQYQFFGFYNFIRKRNKIKNAMGLHVRNWIEKKGLLKDVYLD